MRIPPTKKDAKTKRPSINGKNSKPQEPDSVLHTNSDNSNGYISPVDQNDNYFSQKSDKHSSDEDSSGLAAITAAAESVEDASDVDYFLPNSQTSIESFPISRSNSLKPYTGNNQSDNHNDSIFGHSSISSNYNYNYIPDSNGHSDYVQRESPAVKAAAEAIRASSERYDSIQKSGSDEVSEMELFLSVADVLQNLSPAKPNMKRILESGDYNSMYSTYYGNYTADNSGAQQSEVPNLILISFFLPIFL